MAVLLVCAGVVFCVLARVAHANKGKQKEGEQKEGKGRSKGKQKEARADGDDNEGALPEGWEEFSDDDEPGMKCESACSALSQLHHAIQDAKRRAYD